MRIDASGLVESVSEFVQKSRDTYMAHQLRRVDSRHNYNKGTKDGRVDHKLNEEFERRLRDHAADPAIC